MAKLKISPKIIEEALFGYSENEVFIDNIKEIGDENNLNYFEFEIHGKDIPDCKEVMCEMNMLKNRAGQKFIIMKFVKIK